MIIMHNHDAQEFCSFQELQMQNEDDDEEDDFKSVQLMSEAKIIKNNHHHQHEWSEDSFKKNIHSGRVEKSSSSYFPLELFLLLFSWCILRAKKRKIMTEHLSLFFPFSLAY